MMTTDEMVVKLTKRELEFLINNPEAIDNVLVFFIQGGYSQYTDSAIEMMYNRDIKED
jgi:hypothetical protein